MSPFINLTGQAVLVTGAGRSIGLAIAQAFVARGAVVYGTGRAETSLAAMQAAGVSAWQIEIENQAGMAALIEEIKLRHGRLACLVNNAAVTAGTPLAAVDARELEQMFAINVTALALNSQSYYRAHRQLGGVLVHIASLAGMQSLKSTASYGASKAALLHLNRSMALEWGRHGFRSNAICPGFIASPGNMASGIRQLGRFADGLNARIPLKRWGTPQEIADAAIFLASPQASYINGQALVLDGGLSAQLPH